MRNFKIVKVSLIAAALTGTALTAIAHAGPAEMGTPSDKTASGDAVQGEEVYTGTCIACHGKNGKGTVPGAPDFTKKDGVLTKPDSVLLDHITNGFQSDGALLEMPAMGGNPDLSEEDISNVLAYIREEFGSN